MKTEIIVAPAVARVIFTLSVQDVAVLEGALDCFSNMEYPEQREFIVHPHVDFPTKPEIYSLWEDFNKVRLELARRATAS